MSNAVDALLTRNNLSDLIETFRAAAITKISQLRSMTPERLAELVPNEEQRRNLTASLERNAAPTVGPASIGGNFPDQAPAGGRGRGVGGPKPAWNREEGDRPARKTRPCRPFFSAEGCKYGDDCKYSHDPELTAEMSKSNASISRDQYEENVVVPWDSVKLLLGNKASRLSAINQECGTTNSKIDRPEDYATTYSFKIRGSPSGVARAKLLIEKFVGMTGQQLKEARFNYANEELKHNTRAVQLAAQSNLNNKGTPYELSEAVMKRLVSTFRFQQPNISHIWAMSGTQDKEKFDTVQKFVPKLKGVQAIIFTDQKRVPEMQKRAAQTCAAFGVKTAQFVYPGMTKEERMTALEAFKRGEPNENGVISRLLVTTNDYAKLARKVLIPFVNLVVHFSVPKTKEMYLHQAMCTGRNGHKGISLILLPADNVSLAREYAQSLPIAEFREDAFAKEAETLVYETPSNTLTDPMAEPEPNWKEALEKEKAEKAAAKAAVAADKK